jgi:soluble lytic murein transglycosylase-like protein
MNSLKPYILRSCLVCASVASALLLSTPSFSDSIKLNGKIYDNVYVSPGTSTHYVRFADDGTLVSVPNEEIDSSSVVFSEPDERRAISATWKAKRRESMSHKTLTYNEWRDKVRRKDTKAVPEAKSSTPRRLTQSDLKAKMARRNTSSSRGQIKKFVNSEGVASLTNTPEYFEGKPEYLEVDFNYDLIVVPDKFKGQPDPDMKHIDNIITHYANKYDLDKALVYAVIKQESNGNPKAISHAGARGLMQLMPGTAHDLGVYNSFDPVQNIAGGTQYLSKMKELFDDDVTLVLAGYNAGPGNVKKYNGVPPFKETQNYVRRVQQLQRLYKRTGMPKFGMLASAKSASGRKRQ